MALPSHVLAALLGAWTLGLAVQDPGDPARVQRLHGEGRYGEALGEAAQLDDVVLAAEWRCYLYLEGGDYPQALRAAEEGLAVAPQHRGLLVNAVSAALTIGASERALLHAEALQGALHAEGDGAPAEEHARGARLLGDAQRLHGLELAGRRGGTRARVVVLTGLAVVAGSMLVLALRAAPR